MKFPGTNHLGRLASIASLILALTACEAPPPAGQVLARVNDREITVHQLNRILPLAADTASDKRRDALDRLVRRELAVEEALALRLERDPEVMLRLEESRREVLAAAWADRAAGAPPVIDDGAAARYFAAHPGLFAERRLYRLRTIALPPDQVLAENLQTRLKEGASLPEIRSWLAARGARSAEQEIVRFAEQLPIEAVDRLWRVPAGQAVAFRSPDALTLYHVLSAEPMPLDWKAAAPAIRSHIATQARIAMIESELQRLRQRARIEIAKPAAS